MEGSGPFTLLPPPKVTSIAIAQEAGWAPEAVWTFRKRGKARRKRRYAANTSKYLPTFRRRVLPSSSVFSSPRKVRNSSPIDTVSRYRRIQPSLASLCEQLVSQYHELQQSAPPPLHFRAVLPSIIWRRTLKHSMISAEPAIKL